MPATPQRLVQQHARTSALLGVDFVPSFRAGPAASAQIEAKPTGLAMNPPPALQVSTSRDRAGNEKKLDAARKRYIKDAPHDAFGFTFTNIVFGEGNPTARLMFIGEAPGADEDRTGRPFVGRAGQLLDKMIAAMGVRREDVYIANILKVRPPNNATPTITERLACAPYLYEQITAIAPEVIVTLGLPSSQTLLNCERSMGAMRGQWASFTHEDLTVPVMPTYHPAYLLRAYSPENRKAVWSDLRKVMVKLGWANESQT